MDDLRDLVYGISWDIKDSTLEKVAKEQDKIDKNFGKIADSTEKVNKKIDNSGSSIDDLSSKVSGLEGALKKTVKIVSGAYITRKMFEAGKAAVGVFADFEQGMANVRATMGKITDTDFEKLKRAAIEGGSKTVYTSSQAAEALNYMALAGFKVEESVSALPTVLNLAAGGGLDLARSSDIVTDSMSALSLEVSDLSKFADQLAKTSQTTNTNVDQLGTGIITVGGLARDTNMEIEDLNTWLGILADSGYKGQKGGVALRNVLLNLTAPADDVAMLLEDLGVRVADKTTGKIRNLNDILMDLRQELGKYTQAQQNAILSMIGGKENVQGLRILLKGAGDDYERLKQTITDSTGAAEEMANVQRDTLRGAFKELESAIEGSIITVLDSGTAMADWKKKIKDVASSLTEIIDAVHLLDETPEILQQPTIGKFAPMPADLPNMRDEMQKQLDEAQELVDGWKNKIELGFAGFGMGIGAKMGFDIGATVGHPIAGALIGAAIGAAPVMTKKLKEAYKEFSNWLKPWGEKVKEDVIQRHNKIADNARKNIDEITQALFGFKSKFENFKPIQLIQSPIDTAIGTIKAGKAPQNSIGPVKKANPYDMLPKFAAGTHNTPDTFIAGENGPELITGAKNKRVFNNKELQSTSNSNNAKQPNIIINIYGADKNQFEIAKEVKAVMEDFFGSINEQFGFE